MFKSLSVWAVLTLSALAMPAASAPTPTPPPITQQVEESRVTHKTPFVKKVTVPNNIKVTVDRASLTSKPAPPPPPPKPKPKPVVKVKPAPVKLVVAEKTSIKTKASNSKAVQKAVAKKAPQISSYKKTSVKITPAPTVKVSPGSSQAEAQRQMKAYGWGSSQLSCLVKLWEKESNWKHTADNPSSSAYGIPQALPGSKMSSAGSDWATNPATQIKWGLGYISDRYGNPCSAWGHSQNVGWY